MKWTLLLTLFTTFTAKAWGPVGHVIVAGIAQQYLTPQTKTKVTQLLGRDTLMSISNWPDKIKDKPQYRHTKPWHYVTIPDGLTYHTCRRSSQGAVVEAIERMTLQLNNPRSTHQQRQEALAYLVHFIGDLHQPLHVGRSGDTGGTALQLRWGRYRTDLHEIWDVFLPPARPENLMRQLATFSPREVVAWGAGQPSDWAHEAMELRPIVYTYGPTHVRGWEDRYLTTTGATVNEQFQKGGARLAHWLNTRMR